ncbi:41152_t:CDS:2, partial [Gigaspora margarita]
IGVDNGIGADKGIGVDNGTEIDCTESNVNSYKANQDTTNLVNHMDNEYPCELYDSTYDKLPPHYTHEGFEVEQFEANIFVNVLTIEGIKEWFAAFEEHSKTTMPQTKGYEIVRKKQGDPEIKNPESARNRNTGCSATLCLRLECWRLNTSHPLEVNICFKHNHVINSAESLGFRRVNEEIRDKFIQMFYDGHSPASALYNHEDELHLSASSSEKLVENLADRAINPGYKYVMHLFEHYRNSQLGGQNGASMFQRLNEAVSNYNASGHG